MATVDTYYVHARAFVRAFERREFLRKSGHCLFPEQIQITKRLRCRRRSRAATSVVVAATAAAVAAAIADFPINV